jgi:DNA polymerase-4
LAKIASDWRKPDGLFVIQPEKVETFLSPLPVGRIPGVGKVTEQKLEKLGIRTVGELQSFGRYGLLRIRLSGTCRLRWLSHGEAPEESRCP